MQRSWCVVRGAPTRRLPANHDPRAKRFRKLRSLRLGVLAVIFSSAALAADPAPKTDDNPFHRTFKGPKEALSAMEEREPSAPKAGSLAPDFELSDPEQTRKVRLSSFAGKSPVVLIFGSYT